MAQCIGTHTTIGLAEKGTMYWDTYNCRIGGKGQGVKKLHYSDTGDRDWDAWILGWTCIAKRKGVDEMKRALGREITENTCVVRGGEWIASDSDRQTILVW